MLTGVSMLHVPYKGAAPALTDLVAGQVQVMFDVLVASIELIRGGRLRALAIAADARVASLPDVPPLVEFVPGCEASAWHGIGAPAKTAPEIVGRLNAEITAALADPAVTARFAQLGAVAMPMTTAAFGTFIGEDTAKWAKVIKFAGIKPD